MGNFAENLNLGNRFRPPWDLQWGGGEEHHDSGSGIIFHKKSIGLHIILYPRLLKFWWLDMLYSILLWFIIDRLSKNREEEEEEEEEENEQH